MTQERIDQENVIGLLLSNSCFIRLIAMLHDNVLLQESIKKQYMGLYKMAGFDKVVHENHVVASYVMNVIHKQMEYDPDGFDAFELTRKRAEYEQRRGAKSWEQYVQGHKALSKGEKTNQDVSRDSKPQDNHK